MLEIFIQEPDGRPRDMKRLVGRRNYVAVQAFDPDLQVGNIPDPLHGDKAVESHGKLSLAVDFLVQGEGAYQAPMKYGPVVIPSLDFGR